MGKCLLSKDEAGSSDPLHPHKSQILSVIQGGRQQPGNPQKLMAS